jgi:hypothetical protein
VHRPNREQKAELVYAFVHGTIMAARQPKAVIDNFSAAIKKNDNGSCHGQRTFPPRQMPECR